MFLVLYCVLTNPRLIKQASDCGYFWKDDKTIHAALKQLNSQNMMLKIASESSSKHERKTNDKKSCVMTNFVSVSGTPTSSISNDIKHIDLPKTTKYILFSKGNAKRKYLF